MESLFNIANVVYTIVAGLCLALIFLFKEVKKMGAKESEDKNNYKTVLEAIASLEKTMKREIEIETSKINSEWDKWQIKQEANNLSRDKEINELKKQHRKIEEKFEASLNLIYTELKTINNTITRLVTVQEQEEKLNTQPIQRGRPRGK